MEQAKWGHKLTTSSRDGKRVPVYSLWQQMPLVRYSLLYVSAPQALPVKKDKGKFSSLSFEDNIWTHPTVNGHWWVVDAFPSMSCKTRQLPSARWGWENCLHRRPGHWGLHECQEIYSLPQTQPAPAHSTNMQDRKPLAFPIWKVRRVLKEGQA